MTVQIDRARLEEHGAEIEFNFSGVVIAGQSHSWDDRDGTLIVEVQLDDRRFDGTHFVAAEDIEKITYEDED